MTIYGIGPKLLGYTLAYAIIPTALTMAYPEFFIITSVPSAVFTFLGVILLMLGIPLWVLSLIPLLTGFTQGKLCTSGVYSIVRNPMYSAFIVFLVPALTLFFRSSILFTIPIVMFLIFKRLIKAEERFLEECFGEEYRKYQARVNSPIPNFKTFKAS